MDVVISRGSSKTGIQYINTLYQLYIKGFLNKEEYIYKLALAKVLLFGESQDEVLKWIENQMKGV